VSITSLPLIKLLFGSASTCAEPSCQKNLTTRDDAGRTVVLVQIAHIRSEKPDGPRHDPAYTNPNSFENLMLVCPEHHKQIDDYSEAYPIELLEEWKAGQVAQIGQKLSDTDLHEILRQLQDLAGMASAFTALTTIDLDVDLYSGRFVPQLDDVSMISLEQFRAITLGSGASHLGVGVRNRGLVEVTIATATIEYDFGLPNGPIMYLIVNSLTTTPMPHRLIAHSEANWFINASDIAEGLRDIAPDVGMAQIRARAAVHTAAGVSFEGRWHSAADLPIWKGGSLPKTPDTGT